jgi:hypothetical protein
MPEIPVIEALALVARRCEMARSPEKPVPRARGTFDLFSHLR